MINDIVTVYKYRTQEKGYKNDEEDVVQRRIPTQQAAQALQNLRLYDEQQDDGDSELISRLGRHEGSSGNGQSKGSSNLHQ